MNKKYLIIFALLFQSCFAYRYKTPVCKLYHEKEFPSGLIVGVKRASIEDINGNLDELTKRYYLNDEIKKHDSLIKILKWINLFEEVDYVDKLSRTPSMIIKPIPGPAFKTALGDGAPWIITTSLGIIPEIEYSQNGIYFKRVDKENVEFHCDWQVDKYIGWFAITAKIFYKEWGKKDENDMALN